MVSIYHGQFYQKRMKKTFDQRVRPQSYIAGDVILKRIILPQSDPRGKWTPNYEGSYVVRNVFSGGAIILINMDAEDFSLYLNADIVKKYFV